MEKNSSKSLKSKSKSEKVYEILSVVNKNKGTEYKKVSLSFRSLNLDPQMLIGESGLTEK